MTREEAEIYAQDMSYEDAIHNLFRAKCVPYKKATFTKIHELLEKISVPKGEEEKPMSEYIKKEDIKKKYRQSLIDGLTDDERGLDLSVYADVACTRFNEFVDELPTYSFPDRKKGTIDQIRKEVMEYVTDLDIADCICEVFEKYEEVVPDREKGTDGTLVYNANGHFYGVMGGDAIMERIRGKANETDN